MSIIYPFTGEDHFEPIGFTGQDRSNEHYRNAYRNLIGSIVQKLLTLKNLVR